MWKAMFPWHTEDMDHCITQRSAFETMNDIIEISTLILSLGLDKWHAITQISHSPNRPDGEFHPKFKLANVACSSKENTNRPC